MRERVERPPRRDGSTPEVDPGPGTRPVLIGSGFPGAADRNGLSMVEILLMGFLALVLAIPVMTTIQISTREAAVSEDLIVALVLAQRHLQEILSRPWEEIAPRLPLDLEPDDPPAGDAPLLERFADYRSRFEGPGRPRSRIRVIEVRPGLLSISVTVAWSGPAGPGRRLELIRFRARSDLALRTSYATTGPVDVP